MAPTGRLIVALHVNGIPRTIAGFGDYGHQRLVFVTPQLRPSVLAKVFGEPRGIAAQCGPSLWGMTVGSAPVL